LVSQRLVYMKKITTTLAFILIVFGIFAQNNSSNTMLIRHDTTVLKAEECEWLIKSETKPDETRRSVPMIILETIKKGHLQAADPQTDSPIPSNEIFTWHMPSDTVAKMDLSGNQRFEVIQSELNPDNIPFIKIYSDWYLDLANGKFYSVIKWIELMREVRSPTGYFRGYISFCRVYY
jgi:hypothetical protein